MKSDLKVVAIIAAYNEGDIIGQVVGDLIAQGVSVYFIDNQSTDNTVAEVEAFLGRGVIAIESFKSAGSAQPALYDWTGILKRKEVLASELEADWFIHHDADEFREAPWSGQDLKSGIEMVDGLGYSAIDFELLNFQPTHDRFEPGQDVREAFPFYEPGAAFDKPQIRCWKRTHTPVDLASSGGHDIQFQGRDVFPIRFLLRHYPIRSQAHGQRKVFVERLPRFSQDEKERGWHIQYASVAEDPRFVRNAEDLTRFDAERVRLALCLNHRDAEMQTQELERLGGELELREQQLAHLVRELESSHQQVTSVTNDLAAYRQQVELLNVEAGGLRDALASHKRQMDDARRETLRIAEQLEDRHARVQALEQSWSWRLTGPGRRVVSWLTRKVSPS